MKSGRGFSRTIVRICDEFHLKFTLDHVTCGVEVLDFLQKRPEIPLQYLPICASLAISKGMPYEKALEAVTINPARVMGVEARVGSLDPGKDADLVIWKDRPFVVIQDPVAVFINGERIKKAKRGACASRFWLIVWQV